MAETPAVTAQDIAIALRIITSSEDVLDAAISEQLTRLASVASALVSAYAPNAPDEIKDEAAIRIASYLFDVAPGAINNPQNCFVHCGAMALLSFWREQRATPIGKPMESA